MKRFEIFAIIMLISICTYAQKWQPGRFTDIKDNRLEGLIDAYPSGKGPIKGEAFIIYKENKNAPEVKLSASDIKNFVAGADSFVVAHPPSNEAWPNEPDFVKVVIDEPVKLYVYKGNTGRGGGGFRIAPSVGLGVGSGGYGYGGGGYGGAGVGISLGGGNGGGTTKRSYYFGAGSSELTLLTPQNFEDVMSEIMGDDTEILEGLRNHQYSYNHIDKLINYFNKKKAGTAVKQ